MNLGFTISFSIHFLIIATIVIINWDTLFIHRSGSSTPFSRQVSLVSGSTGSSPSSERIVSTNQKSPQAKTSETTTQKSVKSGGATDGKGRSSGKAAGTGSGRGGAATDVAFPHAYYLELVERKIESLFKPPVRKKDLSTEVHFVLLKTGRISDLKLKKSSGNALFDQAAQRAILSSVPLPPLPADFGSDKLGITYIFLSE